MDQPATLAEIEKFKKTMHEHFVCFDPGDVDEFLIYTAGRRAGGREWCVGAGAHGIDVEDKRRCRLRGISWGRFARDFAIYDQSEMIVSLCRNCRMEAALSSGVERELQHAFEGGRKCMWCGCWRCRRRL